MNRKNNLIYLFFLILNFGFSQNTILKGNVLAEENLENIHVINKTQSLYATTSDKGVFNIEAKTQDTIVFTSVQYKFYTHIVTADNIKNKTLSIKLEILVNKLSEALIGFTLTGDLSKDILNSDAKRPVDFYDFGIPGYTGKPKTKSERLLSEANGAGLNYKTLILQTLSGSIPLNPILNGISGRTKELKKRVALEENTVLLNVIKNRLSEAFFKENELEQTLRAEFFYFCAEDETFKKRCTSNDLETLKFMKEKYVKYKQNLEEKE